MPRKNKKSAAERPLKLEGQLERLIQQYRGQTAAVKIEQNLRSAEIRSYDPAELSLFRLYSAANYDLGACADLESEIEEHGQLFPIYVWRAQSGALEVFAGVKRYLLALAHSRPVKACRLEGVDDSVIALYALRSLAEQKNNPLLLGYAYRVLKEEYGVSYRDLSRLVGASKAQIINRIHLLRLPAPILAALKSGWFSYAEARPLLGLSSEAEQLALFARASAEHLSAHQLEQLVSASKKKDQPRLIRIDCRGSRITIDTPDPESARQLAEKIKRL